MMKSVNLSIAGLLALAIINPLYADTSPRWYSAAQVSQGKVLFQQNCAICHGQNAESIPNWKQTDANGNYPPPPLNGSGHAWHHDLALLQKTVREGGQKLGGQMPPFEQLLDDQQIDNVIAYFQSKWPDETYQKWAGRFEPDAPPATVNNTPDTTYLKQRLGNAAIGTAKPSAISKLYEIRFNDKTLYLSEDGRYAIIGEMIDLKSGVNLSKQQDR